MNTLRQEFCDETNTPMGLDNEFDYIRWLEAKIQALRIHAVVERSEQLKCEHKGRRKATELVEYCEDCKKILFHP
jgi:hypothetical protein